MKSCLNRITCLYFFSQYVMDIDFHGLNTNNELLGVRKDGRCEECVIDIMSEGNVWAYYWLEGKTPVTSNEVEVEADWYCLPYLDDETCI